ENSSELQLKWPTTSIYAVCKPLRIREWRASCRTILDTLVGRSLYNANRDLTIAGAPIGL
ncbi:MAG TPA: hypothetical protein VGS16_15720, partial [Candidatus Dormibacteraeota bacterium]|nr:hypothetical protein [Candidatus Dormibacteraeota bacterium]